MVLSKRLIERCVRIVKKQRGRQNTNVTKSLLREMEITLEHMNFLHLAKLEFLHNLKVFYKDIRDKQINIRRDPQEPSDLRIERDTNHHRYALTLIKLEKQRRDIHANFDPEIRNMELKLAELLSQYELLEGVDGDV